MLPLELDVLNRLRCVFSSSYASMQIVYFGLEGLPISELLGSKTWVPKGPAAMLQGPSHVQASFCGWVHVEKRLWISESSK